MHPTLVHLWVVAQTTATQPAPVAPARDLTFTETVMASMTGAFAVLFTIIPRLLAFIEPGASGDVHVAHETKSDARPGRTQGRATGRAGETLETVTGKES